MNRTLAVTFLIAFLIGFKATLFAYGKFQQHDGQIRQLQNTAHTGLRAVEGQFHLFQGEYGEVSKRQTRDEGAIGSLFAIIHRDEKLMRRLQQQVQRQESVFEGSWTR